MSMVITLTFLLLMVSMVDNILIVQIVYDTHFIPSCPCHFLGNRSNIASMKHCIWECESIATCQTSVYYNTMQLCSLFSEPCSMGRIVSTNNTIASVICSHEDRIITSFPSNPIVSHVKTSNCSLQIESMGNLNRITFHRNLSLLTPPQNFNNLSCIDPGIHGHGVTPVFSRNFTQKVNFNYSFSMLNRSFTVMAWINYDQNYYDMGILGQCSSTSSYSCFHLNVRGRKGYLGFFNKDVNGTQLLKNHRWYHIAAVYNFQTKNQSIFIDGYLDGSTYQEAYQAFSPNMTIGCTLGCSGSSFDGMIDQISLINSSLTVDEILEHASLVFYYSFNYSIEDDSGPNQIQGFSANVCLIDNLFRRSLLFCSSSGYFQVKNLMLLGDSQYNFTFSLWIYPWINHTRSHFLIVYSNKNTSLITIGFDNHTRLTIQSFNGTGPEIVGPQCSSYTWTHIALVYTLNTSLVLFINGTSNGTVNSFVYTPNNTLATIIVGSSTPLNRFQGQIDEFRFYSRSLLQTEIQRLSTV